MLEACATKNYMRVDNVFCSADLIDTFISCNTYPQLHPQKTDHMPVISVLEMELERTIHVEKHNYNLTDWEEFRKTLGRSLEDLGETEELHTVEQFHNKLARVYEGIKAAVREHMPLTRLSPYTKRWWNKGLSDQKRSKEKMSRKSY